MDDPTLADEIGVAAKEARYLAGSPPDYVVSDNVDQMAILHEILLEIRMIRVLLEDRRT